MHASTYSVKIALLHNNGCNVAAKEGLDTPNHPLQTTVEGLNAGGAGLIPAHISVHQMLDGIAPWKSRANHCPRVLCRLETGMLCQRPICWDVGVAKDARESAENSVWFRVIGGVRGDLEVIGVGRHRTVKPPAASPATAHRDCSSCCTDRRSEGEPEPQPDPARNERVECCCNHAR
jgi:hypothetical protein